MKNLITSNYNHFAGGQLDGNDILRGGSQSDVIWTGSGTDTVFSGKGDDLIFVGSGIKRIKAGDGIDIAVFEGPETSYEVKVRKNGVVKVWGTHVQATLTGVEKLMFRTKTLSSDVIDVSELHRDKVNRIQLDPSRPLYGSDKSSALYAVGDGVTLIGGRQDDCFIGKGKGTKVFYEGSMLDYNIYRDAKHDIIVSHPSVGNDQLTNIETLIFRNGGEISRDKITYQLKGGAGDDRLEGLGQGTRVLYDGSMFDYAIHRNGDGSLLVRSHGFGNDTLVNIDWLYFSNGTRIHNDFIPDEWLGNTGFQGLYTTRIDPGMDY